MVPHVVLDVCRMVVFVDFNGNPTQFSVEKGKLFNQAVEDGEGE